MNRRKFVIGAGSIVTGTAATAAFAGTGAATAEADNEYYAGYVSLKSDDGSIDWVAVNGNGQMDWKGLDNPAQFVQIVTSVRVEDEDGNTEVEKTQINDTGLIDLDQGADWGNHDDELSGPGTRGTVKHGVGQDTDGERDESNEWVIIGEKPSDVEGSDYPLPNGSIPASELTVDDDGTQQRFVVKMISEYTLYDGNQESQIGAQATGKVNVDVTNIEEQTSTASGEGDANGGASNEGSQLD